MARQLTHLNRAIALLRSTARLGPDAEALVAVAQGLASAVDRQPDTAALWREYRAAVLALLSAGDVGDADDDAQEWLVSIRTPGVRAAVGDAKES